MPVYIISKHKKIASLRPNKISLFNGKGEEVQFIEVYPESLFPKRVSFPGSGINLEFSGFQEDKEICYAGKVRVDNLKGRRELIFKNKKNGL